MDNDERLMQRVHTELAMEPGIQIDMIRIGIRDGVVRLTGHVPSDSLSRFAERSVLRVDGTRGVHNELVVQVRATEAAG